MNSKHRTMLVLWTTSKCNLKCKYCYAATENKSDMSFDTAKSAIDYLKDNKLKIQFAGGEPLLNFELIRKIYYYVSEKKYDVIFQMQTNGTLITAEMADELKKINIAMGISIDGPPDINEILRGKTELLIQGMNNLARAGVMVNINSVVTETNVDRLFELADVAIYFGNVAGIGLDLLRNAGNAVKNEAIVKNASPQKLRQGIIELYKRFELISKLTGKKLYVRSVREAERRLLFSNGICDKNYCYASMGRSYVVLPSGNVYPCGSLINNVAYYMGNIKDSDKLKEISLKPSVATECDYCEYYAFCSGGCPSRLLVNNIDSIENSLDCIMKKVSFELVKSSISVVK